MKRHDKTKLGLIHTALAVVLAFGAGKLLGWSVEASVAHALSCARGREQLNLTLVEFEALDGGDTTSQEVLWADQGRLDTRFVGVAVVVLDPPWPRIHLRMEGE